MVQIPNRVSDILKSKTTRGLPRAVDYGTADVASHVQGLDNFHTVFAIRPGEHVVMLTDPLLDPRVVQAVYGLARARGATFAAYQGPSTRLMEVPDEARALVERANFVVSTWFASIIDPFCINLRREKGQRWIKITFFRNFDLLHTPQARFPLEVLGEIIRASSRAYPDAGNFDLRFTDPRGSNVVVGFTEEMRRVMKADNRWRGHNVADEDGCYIHFLPTHGPNLYEVKMVGGSHTNPHMPVNGILYPQWAVGFERPFEEKIGVEFKNGRVAAIHGKSEEAEICVSSSVACSRSWAAATIPRRRASTSIPPVPIRRARCISGSTRWRRRIISSASCRTGKSRTSTWTSSASTPPSPPATASSSRTGS